MQTQKVSLDRSCTKETQRKLQTGAVQQKHKGNCGLELSNRNRKDTLGQSRTTEIGTEKQK